MVAAFPLLVLCVDISRIPKHLYVSTQASQQPRKHEAYHIYLPGHSVQILTYKIGMHCQSAQAREALQKINTILKSVLLKIKYIIQMGTSQDLLMLIHEVISSNIIRSLSSFWSTGKIAFCIILCSSNIAQWEGLLLTYCSNRVFVYDYKL